MRRRDAAVVGVLVVTAWSGAAWAALSCGTVTTNITGTDRSTVTQSYVTPAGSNQTLVVGVAGRDTTDTVSTVTHAGNSMTEKIELHHTTDVSVATLYFLKAPAGGTNNVVITWTGLMLASGFFIMTCADTHADADPFRNAGVSAQGLSTAPSATATDASGDLVIDVMAVDSNTTAPTQGADQTVIYAASDGGEIGMGASYQSGGSGGVMSWTVASNDWAIVAAVLRAAVTSNIGLFQRRAQ